jgi:hypothetical protein
VPDDVNENIVRFLFEYVYALEQGVRLRRVSVFEIDFKAPDVNGITFKHLRKMRIRQFKGFFAPAEYHRELLSGLCGIASVWGYKRERRGLNNYIFYCPA